MHSYTMNEPAREAAAGNENKELDRCNTCGCSFDTDPNCYRQSFGNRSWLATTDDDGNVIQECCELCAQEAQDAIEEEIWPEL